MKKLIKYFINSPLIVNVLTIFILLAGGMTYLRIQKQAFPNVDEPGVTLVTIYPGASPEDVELNVTIPIEEKMRGIKGVEKFISRSYENMSRIVVIFDGDETKNFDKIKQEIRREIDSIANFPPEVTERPRMYEWGGKYVPVLEVGIFGKNIGEKELVTRAKELKERLLDSPYVSNIDESGKRDREVHIELDLAKMNRHYISFEDVIGAIRSHNIQTTSGTLKSYLSERNIVTLSRFRNILDVKNVIIRSTFNGSKIVLSDIAAISDTFEHERNQVRFNGKRGIILTVYKKPNSDIVKASDDMNKILDEFNEEVGSNGNSVHASPIIDFSEPTRSRLKIVTNNALIGLVLVVAVLFLFLNFKNAFWTALGIPFSIAFALIFLPFFNITINSISLLGMIVVLGMIVDDAIVISENIYRHKLMGDNPLKAALTATNEVGHAVLTTVLTTILAFFPLLIMKGVAGEYSREIPMIIAFILLGSLFESLFILPAHTTHELKTAVRCIMGLALGAGIGYFIAIYFALPGMYNYILPAVLGVLLALCFIYLYKEERDSKEKVYIIILKKGYALLLNLVLKYRWLMVLIFAAVMVGGLMLFSSLKFDLFPSMEANIIDIDGEIKGGLSLDYTKDQIILIEDFIDKTYDKKELTSYVSKIGNDGYKERFSINIFLSSAAGRKLKADTVIAGIKEKMNEVGTFDNLEVRKSYVGAPNMDSSIEIEISGNDDEIRQKLTGMVYEDLLAIDGMTDITRTDKRTKKEINIIPNYDIVSRYGVTALRIADSTKVAYDGYVATYIQTPDDRIPYRVLLNEGDRRKLATLDKLKVLNNRGKLIPVSAMVTITEGEALSEIKHFNGYRTTTIFAKMDSKKITPAELYSRLNDKYKNISRDYKGFRLHLGGDAEMSNEIMNELTSSMVIAIAGIFMLLIFLFRSITQPIIVMLVIPFGIVGVSVAFYLHGMPLSFMSFMGLIGLSGVVINDSLVMVEYINQLKKKGIKGKIRSLVIEGAVTRLRPVLLTTLTTFAGLLPTAYGFGGRDSMILPTAMSLSWGILFGTFITLLIVPTFYLLETDVRWLLTTGIPGLARKITGKGKETATDSEGV